MIKRFILTIAGFLLIVCLLGAAKFAQIKEMSSKPHVMPANSVTSVEAKTDSWRPVISAIGSLAPVQGVTISAEMEGVVQKIAVENGVSVKAGDLLLQLDSTVEDAQLKAAQARLQWAQLQQKRAVELRDKNTVSQAEVDQANAGFNQAEAEVAALKATIEKKAIRAPFDGRVGIRQVNLGQFVSRGQPLLPLQKLNPLFVNFTLPQRQLPQVAMGQTVRVVIDAFGDRSFAGKVVAINPEVDAATRNVSVQAQIENPDEMLRVGMFARVELEMPEAQSLVVLPATAISYAAYGNSVFVIEKMKDKDGKEYLGVRQQFVKLGDRRGDFVAVLEGVKPGEVVASSGVFKLRNAVPVQVNNDVNPESTLNPRPANT